jgi:carbon storage regulator CsrA
MLALSVKAGEYITIGPDITIQVLKVGDLCRVAIDAPRELTVERAKIHEAKGGQVPESIKRVREKKNPPKVPRFKQERNLSDK